MSVAPRRYIERMIARRLVADLLKCGYAVSVNDGEETVVTRSVEPQRIFAALASTDDDTLIIYQTIDRTNPLGWIKLVYGNDGPDLISDYTTNLDPVIEPIFKWIAERIDRTEWNIPAADDADQARALLLELVTMCDQVGGPLAVDAVTAKAKTFLKA